MIPKGATHVDKHGRYLMLSEGIFYEWVEWFNGENKAMDWGCFCVEEDKERIGARMIPYKGQFEPAVDGYSLFPNFGTKEADIANDAINKMMRGE